MRRRWYAQAGGSPTPDVRGSQPSKKATFGPPGGAQSPVTPFYITLPLTRVDVAVVVALAVTELECRDLCNNVSDIVLLYMGVEHAALVPWEY